MTTKPLLPLFLLVGVLVFSITLPAQSLTSFGIGCPGNGKGPLIGHSLNTSGGTLSNQTLPNEYGYPVKISAPTLVLGVQYFCKSVTTTTVTGIGFYREDPLATGKPSATATTTGFMPTDTKLGWYTGMFEKPMMVKANELFWVSQIETNLVHPADLTSGSAPPGMIYWQRPASAWTTTSILKYPAYRIITGLYGTSVGTPLLWYPKPAVINSLFDIKLNFAMAPAPVFLLLGRSRTTWASLPLPFDLTSFGATGCKLYSSMLFMFSGVTDRSGQSILKLPIPNDAFLKGVTLYNQWLVMDPMANPLKLTMSNGGAFTIN